MEKNGYITRNAVDYDARLKKICVTEKARALHNSIINEIIEMERILSRGITDSEMEIFFSVAEKIKNNLKETF